MNLCDDYGKTSTNNNNKIENSESELPKVIKEVSGGVLVLSSLVAMASFYQVDQASQMSDGEMENYRLLIGGLLFTGSVISGAIGTFGYIAGIVSNKMENGHFFNAQ